MLHDPCCTDGRAVGPSQMVIIWMVSINPYNFFFHFNLYSGKAFQLQ